LSIEMCEMPRKGGGELANSKLG